MEHSLSGRGILGSRVGASEEVKKTGGIDSSLNEYAVCLTLPICNIETLTRLAALESCPHQWYFGIRGRFRSAITSPLANGICWTATNS